MFTIENYLRKGNQLTEDQMLGGVLFAHQEMQTVIAAVKELTAEAGKPSWDWQPPEENVSLQQAVNEGYGDEMAAAYQICSARRSEL